MSHDASATFRGFRHQALYVLWRILNDADAARRTYRPEGSEDLAVYDEHFRLIEAVQVKDHVADLSLSKLKPVFWERFHRRRKDWPNSETKLASFGGIGAELKGAIEGKAAERSKVLKKLCVIGVPFTERDAVAMLDSLNGKISHPVASELGDSVLEAIRGTNVGGDVKSAAELLMYWVFEASEQRRGLTRRDLLAQLERIGAYLAALRDSSAEWGINVLPLNATPISDEQKSRWTTDYRNGVQAKWEHILSGADCPRSERLAEIHQKLATAPTVIIRGASGQGKSTLGWRYMHDFGAEGLRFYIRRVESRTHASQIANALGDHVRKLNLSAVVYVDVSPSDVGWSELLSELAAAGLKVLAAVREEDFRRANLSIGDFHFDEVTLDRLTREEAKAIFAELRHLQSAGVLDFEDAWAQFNMAHGGPLLEFTHLVTQGELLYSRINTQVVRLQNDAVAGRHGLTQKHIELLALSAIANETGARVSLSGVCDEVGLSPVSLPLRVLQAEYFLCLDDNSDGPAVAPLHALRSKAIVDSLFGEMPKAWMKYAQQVLPHILDTDIEPFLLAAFSRRAEQSHALIAKLNDTPLRSWTHAAGISASLIWEGINRYEMKNRVAIVSAIEKYGTAWWILSDSCVGSAEDVTGELRKTLENGLSQPMDLVPFTPKSEVFELFEDWAAKAAAPPPCKVVTDWKGAGDIAYWLGQCQGAGRLRDNLESILPDELSVELDLEYIASFVSGRANLADVEFALWHERMVAYLTTRFLADSMSEYLADDGQDLTVYFSTPLADIACRDDPKATDWHWQTMKRLRLLRMLFPNRETYGAAGLGLSPLQLEHNPTLKRIPSKSLPSERSVYLTATFHALVAFRHQRVDSWKQYSDAALKYRQAVCKCFRKLHRASAKLLSTNPPPSNAFKELPVAEIDSLRTLAKLPMFPRCAVDEWGFVSESRDESFAVGNQLQAELFRRFGDWRKEASHFVLNVDQVLANILPTILLFVKEQQGYTTTEEEEKPMQLSLFNLASAWEGLPKIQSQFRKCFGHLYSHLALDELDKYERSNFRHLWSAAFALHHERDIRVPNFASAKDRQIEQLRTGFLHSLVTEIERVLGAGAVSIRNTPWLLDGEPSLRIICDHRSMASLSENRSSIVLAIWRACQFRAWRNMEWQPIVIEWPKLAVFHTLNGRALVPACIRLTTMALCATDENFELQQHHLTESLVDMEQFASSGVPLIDNPLIERLFAFRDAVIAFCVTVPRYFEMLEMGFKHDIPLADVERMLPCYSKELTLVWQQAQNEFELLLNVLTSSAFPEALTWKEGLTDVCKNLLFSATQNKSLSLTHEDFEAWSTIFEVELQQMHSLVADILSASLSHSSAPQT